MKPILLAAVAAVVVAPVFADESGTRPLSLQDCIQMALQKNLSIRVAKIDPMISFSLQEQVYGDYDPNLNFGASQDNRASVNGVDDKGRSFPGKDILTTTYNGGLSGLLPTGLNYGITADSTKTSFESNTIPYSATSRLSLSQPLLKNFWIDRTRLNIQVRKLDVKTSAEALRQQFIDSITTVAQDYYDLIAAIENVKVQEAAVTLADRLLSETKKRVELGALAQLDIQDAQSQLARSKADLISAQATLGNATTALKSVINDDLSAWNLVELVPTESLAAVPEAFNKIDSWSKCLTYRPDLAQLRNGLESQKIQVKFSRNQLFPLLDLTGSYGLGGASYDRSASLGQIRDREFPDYSFGFTMSFPIGNRTARESFKQAKLTADKLLLQYKYTEQTALSAVEVAVRAAQNSLEQVGASKEARVFAEAALDAEQKKLDSGKSTSYLVLQKQRDVTSARSLEIKALSDYKKSIYGLSQAEGYTLQRLGITLNIQYRQ